MESALYTRFKVAGTDISAFLVDGSYDWSQSRPPRGRQSSDPSGAKKGLFMLSVLDRCGMSAVLQQVGGGKGAENREKTGDLKQNRQVTTQVKTTER